MGRILKKIYADVFDTNGSYVDRLNTFAFTSVNYNINSGLGSLSLSLNQAFKEDIAIDYGYRVDISVADEGNKSGTKIWTGRVNKVRAFDSNTENIVVDGISYIDDLSRGIYRDGTKIVYESPDQELSQTIKDLITQHRTNMGSDAVISNDFSNIENTGVNKVVRFKLTYFTDAISHILKFAGASFVWFLDSDNKINVKEVSTTADHLFHYGYNVIDIETARDGSQAVDAVIVNNGRSTDDQTEGSNKAILKRINESSPITTEKFHIVQDGRIITSSGADNVANRYLDIYGGLNYSSIFRVPDDNIAAGYNIEDVNVGDTCKIVNVESQSVSTEVQVITKINYNFDFIDIYTEDISTYVSRVNNENRQLVNNISLDLQTLENYTT